MAMRKRICIYKLTGFCKDSRYYRINNFESYDGLLPNDKYFKPTSKWRLFINYKLQPQNDLKLWSTFIDFLAFKVVDIPQLQKVLNQLLIKVSSGYIRKFEIESFKNVPFAIIKLIAINYLMVEVSIFKDVYFMEDDGQFIVPYGNSPKGRNIKWQNIYLQQIKKERISS